MIIIQNTGKMQPDEVREFVLTVFLLFAQKKATIWIHKEKHGREVAINTDDDPIRPGMLAYDDYLEGGVDFSGDVKFWPLWELACQELEL